jgi:hypothetical protein
LEQGENEEVTTICADLYDMSAKCNRYMGNDGDYAVSFVCFLFSATKERIT